MNYTSWRDGKKVWRAWEGNGMGSFQISQPRRLEFFGGVPLQYFFVKEKSKERKATSRLGNMKLFS